MVEQREKIPDFLRRARRGKPPADLTIYPNGNEGNMIDPQKLLGSVRLLKAQTPQGVRILRRRIKRRSPF